MRPFAAYVGQLEAILQAGSTPTAGEIDRALDGQPSIALRQLVPLPVRRAAGAFFTSVSLASRAIDPIAGTITRDARIADPACGAGDLLLAAARHLPLGKAHGSTLENWGRHLAGLDIHPEFVSAARLRIALAAARISARPERDPRPLAQLLRDIRVGSCLEESDAIVGATHIVLNPPYTSTVAPPDCPWAAGSVNSAAVFLAHVVRHAQERTTIVAILPDVLRSGSRYERWRAAISARLDITRVDVVGQFAPEVDVDVFILTGVVRQPAPVTFERWRVAATDAQVVSDLFEVRVGALVPYRDPERGPWRPVLTPRSLPAWETVRVVPARRRFSGRTEEGPFVVVRRTSRPGDRARAVGTVIALREPAVVENHLLVLRPRDRRIQTCQRLIASLRRPETTDWLDRRIRCRHLTVGSIRELPLGGDAPATTEERT